MSFTGFDVDKASLKNSKPQVKKSSPFYEDPVSSMIPTEDPAPITNDLIQKQKRKNLRNNQNKTRRKSTKKVVQVEKIASEEDAKSVEREPINFTKEANQPEPVQSKELDIVEVSKRQKALEAENKLRRQALAREVQTRSQNIIAEAQKLKNIENEIKKLDQLLSADVSKLRDEIDNASWEYSKAKTRFDLAETEYNEAKNDYEQKDKKKLELTQSLMTLIKDNEERKRIKLENLVAKLNMDAAEVKMLEIEEEERLKIAAEEQKKRNELAKIRIEEDKIRIFESEKKNLENGNVEKIDLKENVDYCNEEKENKPVDTAKLDELAKNQLGRFEIKSKIDQTVES